MREDAAMSDSPVEEEEEKSDVVDAVREAVKERSIVVEREIVLACPSSFSELAKLTSRSCLVKLKSGLGCEMPARRLTRSMLKPEADEDHMNLGREGKDTCVAKGSEFEAKDHRNSEKDAATLVACGREEEEPHEQNSVVSIGLSLTSGLRRCGVKKAVNDTVDKPLRRLTRSLVKQDSPDLESKNGSLDLGKVDVNANDVGMDGFQNPLVTTPNKRGRPRKFVRSFPAKLKELFDSGMLEGLTVYYLRCAKVYLWLSFFVSGLVNE